MKEQDGRTGPFVDKTILIIITIWIIFGIIFGFTDLDISNAVVDKESSRGTFGAVFGEAPGYGIIAVAIVVLIGSHIEDTKKQKIVGYAGMVFGITLTGYGVMRNHHTIMISGVAIAAAILLLLILTFKKDWKVFKRLALLVVLLAVINPLLFVQTAKILWGRVRFIDLAPGFSNYTPWFVPQGPVFDNSSFPSGHTAMGWMLLPLLILLREKDWKTPVNMILSISVFGWGLFVGASRVVTGAHYASDVLFSTGMAFITAYCLYKSLYPSKSGGYGRGMENYQR